MIAVVALLVLSGAPRDAFGFTGGMEALEIDSPGLTSRSCVVECHADVAAQFAKTQHAHASTDPIFQRSRRVEPATRCLNCHDPLSRLGESGVTCAVCHLREGVVLSSRESPRSPHPVRVTPGLRDGTLCQGCHQFNFTRRELPMQDTFGEWRAYVAEGGRRTCVTCHMRDGHTFVGAHQPRALAANLSASARVLDDGRVELSLRTIGVGHRFPTGDVFRTLSVEVSSPRAPTHFRAVALLGRRYALTPEPQVVIDTTLAPGEVRAVMLGPSSWVERVRLRYHFEPMGGGVEPALVLDEPISALLTR